LPYDAILEKLEETDPDLIDEVRGLDSLHDLRNEYPDYVRSEIIDWTPDAPWLESEHTRRDPALSRSIVNLRYNATRGSRPELPRHTELFYGFTDRDPRGPLLEPRFDVVRGHITSRAANLTVSMGDNDRWHEAERPWTNQSISYGMKELHRRLKNSTRVFTVQKEGRPWGRNVAADAFAGRDLRAAQLGAGGESMAPTTERFYGSGPARFAGSDYGPAGELYTDGVRGVDGAHREGAERAPWRHTAGEADLGVQQYGQERGGGRMTFGPGATGGARARAGGSSQDWSESHFARSANRQVLGATMALAARNRAAARSGQLDQAPGPGYAVRGPHGSGLAPARDVGLAYRRVTEDSVRRPGLQDGEAFGPAVGITPAAHPERALRAVSAATTPNDHLANVEAIVTGLREGTAASRRRIASQVVADGTRHLAVEEGVPGARRGLRPGADPGSVSVATDMATYRPAAAEGLEVHTYGTAPPRPEHRAALGRGAYDPATWHRQSEALPVGRSQAPGWRSMTQAQTMLGEAPGRVFGGDVDTGGYGGAAPVGPKSLRAGAWSDSAALTDEVGGFADGVSIGA
jgi:hypothetical protein